MMGLQSNDTDVKKLTYKQVADSQTSTDGRRQFKLSGHAEKAWNVFRTAATLTRRRDRSLEIGVRL